MKLPKSDPPASPAADRMRFFWPETDEDCHDGFVWLDIDPVDIARLEKLPLDSRMKLLEFLTGIRASTDGNLRSQRWKIGLYGGGRNAKDKIPGRTGLVDDTRHVIETLINRIEDARQWSALLDELAWNTNLPTENLHSEVTTLARKLPRLRELAVALVHPKRKRGRKTIYVYRQRDLIARLRQRLLAGGASPGDAKELSVNLTKAVTKVPKYWRGRLDLDLPCRPK